MFSFARPCQRFNDPMPLPQLVAPGTAVTFGSLVSSCEKASQWQRALDLAAQATSRPRGQSVGCQCSRLGKGWMGCPRVLLVQFICWGKSKIRGSHSAGLARCLGRIFGRRCLCSPAFGELKESAQPPVHKLLKARTNPAQLPSFC